MFIRLVLPIFLLLVALQLAFPVALPEVQVESSASFANRKSQIIAGRTTKNNKPKYRILTERDFPDLKAVSAHGRNDGEDFSGSQVGMLAATLRALYLLLIFSPVIMTSPFAYISQSFRNAFWYSLLCHIIGHSGAAFIKWGQWSSTRPDMFNEEFCTALSSLHDSAPVHSFSFTESQIAKEFGISVYEMFDDFDERPIASGSIAQVYKARLDGHDVAVKVRHPNVVENIRLDFKVMKALAALLESIPGLSWLNLSGSLAQFSETIGAQTRLDVEGRHLILLNRNFKKWKNVGFPKPIILSQSVLVESFEHGESVAEFTKLYKSNTDLEYKLTYDLAHFILTKGEDLYLNMLLIDNLMHADLHPGNILIQPKGECSRYHDTCFIDNKIILVDAGMIAVLNRDEQENFIGLLAAMGKGNALEAADYVLRFSSKTRHSDENVFKFKEDMKLLFAKVCRGYGTGTDVGTVLRGLLRLLRDHKITIDANYATLVLNALCLDGLGGQILPMYNILDAAKPLLEFYRNCKRTVGLKLFHALVPLAQHMKHGSDHRFLQNLKRGILMIEPNTNKSSK